MPRFIRGNPLPHSAVSIYLWACVTLASQLLHAYALLLFAGAAMVCALAVSARRFVLLLRRTRWILISLLLIYAYAGQGELLWPQFGAFSPVVNGVLAGWWQIVRLLAVLAGLAVLLTLLTQSQLIGGLYTLLYPATWLGLRRERLAVRLALTLRYAENAMQDTADNWRVRMERMLAYVKSDASEVELHAAPLSRFDRVLMLASSAAILGLFI